MAKAYQTYPAHAFHPDFGNEAVEGTILFTNLALEFQSTQANLEIPILQLRASIEHAGEGRIVFQDVERPELLITTPEMEVLEITSIPAIDQLREEETARLTRNEVRRRIKTVVYFCLGCVLLVWLGMMGTGAMVRAIAARVSPETEKKHGDALFKELQGEFVFVGETSQVVRVAALAEPLLRVTEKGVDWRFHLVKEEFPNAFAIPGGHIVMTTGLLNMCSRPEELLGVLAHELAHVTRKHEFRHRIASAGPLLVFKLFVDRRGGGAMGMAAAASALLVHRSFSQEYEKEADDSGWDYLVAANIDPRGMIETFRKLKEIEEKEKFIEIVPHAFQTHPAIEKRIARLERKWKRAPRKTGFIELEANGLFPDGITNRADHAWSDRAGQEPASSR